LAHATRPVGRERSAAVPLAPAKRTRVSTDLRWADGTRNPDRSGFEGAIGGFLGPFRDTAARAREQAKPLRHNSFHPFARVSRVPRCAGSNLPPFARGFRYLRSLSDLWTPFGRFLTHLGDRACPWMHRTRGITGTRCPTAALHPSPVDRRGGGQNQRPAASRAGVSGPDPGWHTTTSLRSPDGPEPVGTATIVPRVAIGGPGQCACWYGASRHAVNGAGP
jgi:hypothetical protein